MRFRITAPNTYLSKLSHTLPEASAPPESLSSGTTPYPMWKGLLELSSPTAEFYRWGKLAQRDKLSWSRSHSKLSTGTKTSDPVHSDNSVALMYTGFHLPIVEEPCSLQPRPRNVMEGPRHLMHKGRCHLGHRPQALETKWNFVGISPERNTCVPLR